MLTDTAVEQVYAALVRGDSLPASIERAHEAILERAQSDPALEGMGTTIVAALRHGSKIDLAWVGDSRIYAFTGELIQLSSDHTFVQDLVQSGELSQEEADLHPQRNILRQALGQRQSQPLQVGMAQVNLEPRHRLLLCTDGVHDMLTAAGIADALRATRSSSDQLEALKEAVLQTDASDNFTAVIIEG